MSISELLEAIDFIQVAFNGIRFSKFIEADCKRGLLLSEISTKLSKSKHFVRSDLSKEEIKFRIKYAETMALRKQKRGKHGAQPYYGSFLISRTGRKWSWTSVSNIVTRYSSGLVKVT